ncbi:MAG: 3-keto-disaccharide hydrolase [Verrucomicrobiales bacterium]
MKLLKPLVIIAATLATLSFAEDKKDDGMTALFNGKDTDGWKNPYEWGEIKVVDNEIHLTAEKKFFLVTEKTFKNFIFEGEILLPDGQANSGFMYRCHVKPNKVFGYQAEVDGSDRGWSGGLYDEGRRAWLWPTKEGDKVESSQAYFKKPEVQNALKRSEWNHYKIQCQGDHLQVWVNGVQTTNYHDKVDAEGHLGIQHHGEKGQTYRFRNLRLKELP